MQNYSMLLYITNSFIHQPSSSGKQNACFRELENWKNGLCSSCNWIKLHIRHLVLWFLVSCFFVKCELLPFSLCILLYFLADLNNPLFLQWSLERAEFAVFCLQSPMFFPSLWHKSVQILSRARKMAKIIIKQAACVW